MLKPGGGFLKKMFAPAKMASGFGKKNSAPTAMAGKSMGGTMGGNIKTKPRAGGPINKFLTKRGA